MLQTTESTKDIADLHFEHKLWMNHLKFYKQEIEIFNHYMEELVQKNANKDALQELEHFQNQYILQGEVIEDMLHEIKRYKPFFTSEMNNYALVTDTEYFDYHERFKEKMEQFIKIYDELKNEFMQFLSRWL